jgi:hypothetical protein
VIHILTSQKWAGVAAISGSSPVFTREELTGGDCLIAFNSGVIVPKDALARYQRAFNFHAAPPRYPGRDPHHWAVYEGAEWYGVTCHVMTERVDAGPIIATEAFEIRGMSPQEIRRYAEGRLLALFNLWAPKMARGDVKPNGERWVGQTRKRADAVALSSHPAFADFRPNSTA